MEFRAVLTKLDKECSKVWFGVLYKYIFIVIDCRYWYSE